MIYLYLFLEFFKIGLFTFGGGYAMIPLIKETVLNHNWLSEDLFYNFIGVCESTPGPVAINMATYIGSVQGGLLGSIIATLGVVLPSFIIILLIAIFLSKFFTNKYVGYVLEGIKPVILGLILSAGLVMLLKAIGYESLKVFNIDYKSIIIFLIICITFIIFKIFKRKLNTIFLILYSSILGIVVCLISELL